MGHQQGLTISSPPASHGAGGAMHDEYWRLSSAVTACFTSGRIIFLDIARDRYLALPPDCNDAFHDWLQSPDQALPQSCLPMLAELGLNGKGAPPPTIRSVRRPIPMDSPYLDRQRPRAGDILTVAQKVIAARAALRSRSLADALVSYFPPQGPAPSHPGDLLSRLAIFRSARPLVPVRRVCLHDCLALSDWLGRGTEGMTLVLGVSALPFAAHCWLQLGEQVVDDHPESPSRYRPILHLQ